MSPIVDRSKVLALIAAIDEQYRVVNNARSRLQDRLKDVEAHRNRLGARRSHLVTIVEAITALKEGEQLLGIPLPAKAVEVEETMYLGATPDESLRGGSAVEPTS